MKHKTLNHLLTPIVSVILILALMSSIYAQPSASPDEVRITVYMIEASNGTPGTDAEIKDIVKELRSELRYSTYKLLSKKPRKIKIGSQDDLDLPGSRRLILSAEGYEDNRIKLRVKIAEKSKRDILNTEFRIVEGGTIIIGAYTYGDGKLILAISADT
jgi:hypothetical protein